MADQTKVVVGVAIKNKQNTGGSCSTGIPTQSKDILVDGSTGTTLDVALDNITTENHTGIEMPLFTNRGEIKNLHYNALYADNVKIEL